MFAARDISIQTIDGDNLFIVQLDSTSPDGYLRKELPMCGLSKNPTGKSYIPRTEISVKVYEDKAKCCEGVKDYDVCVNNKCSMLPVNHHHTHQQLKYVYDVKGTTFKTSYGHKSSRRRRLLARSRYGNCRL
jgi:hypothetical protein